MGAEIISIADDVCDGAAAIGAFIGADERRALRLCYAGVIPAWKEGGLWRMRKSRYLRLVAEREEANLAGAVTAENKEMTGD